MTTTLTTAPKRRRWWQYAGPWPLYPIADGLISGLIVLSVRSFLITGDTVLGEILSAATFGVIVFAVLILARRYARRLVQSLWGYLGAMTLAIVLATSVRFVQGYVPDYPDLTVGGDIAFAAFRTLVGVLILQSIIGILQEQLQHQVDTTQAALELVEQQAEALLKADEDIRRSVATLLHDRVQGGILASCIRLQGVAEEHAGARETVESIIHELEQLRALDVRRAVRTLSPSLKDIDLETAITDLADPYASAVEVTVDVARDAVPDPNTRLALYRIIEQGLLNAVDHGRARHINISIQRIANTVDLRMTDDGTGLASGTASGFGSMLIDTWCRSLHGTWSLANGAGGGAVLRATLPTLS